MSDHIDGPRQTADPVSDLTDLFAFTSPTDPKRTVLIAIAHERANPHQERTLRELVGDPGLEASGVTELRTIIADTGALEYTENLITELLDTSLAAVAHPGITAEAQEILTQLAYAATKRSV
jgi:geranylgeranyl diphosphate synthase type I